MTPVGKILILPKGRYDADTVYKMLDLVMHNGTSWIAKKTVVGIEPSEENAEYWQKLVDIGDAIDHGIEEFFGSGDSSLPLTIPSLTLYNSDNADMRGTLGVDEKGSLVFGDSTVFNTLNLDNYLRKFLDTYMANYLFNNSYNKIKIVSYVGTGKYGIDNPCSLTFDFAPKIIKFMACERISLGTRYQRGYEHSLSSTNNYGLLDVIVCDSLPTEFDKKFTAGLSDGESMQGSTYAKKSEDGKTISWYSNGIDSQCNNSGEIYYFMAIG